MRGAAVIALVISCASQKPVSTPAELNVPLHGGRPEAQGPLRLRRGYLEP